MVREMLAGVLDMPAEEVLHYAIVVIRPGQQLAHAFCGLTANGAILHAAAIQSILANQADIEAAKLTAGATACGDEAARK